MPLTLLTGPANAGKARALLDAVRRDMARGAEPLLIVPTREDVERYRRELAASSVAGGRGVRGAVVAHPPRGRGRTRGGGSRRAAPLAVALGDDAGPPVRVRRSHASAARCRADAGHDRRRAGERVAHLRARPRGV